MPVTVRGGDILFNNGTSQTTAFSMGFNTVGSYCMLYFWGNGFANPTAGASYASGGSGATNTVWAGVVVFSPGPCGSPGSWAGFTGTTLSGTWRWMASDGIFNNAAIGLGVRIS